MLIRKIYIYVKLLYYIYKRRNLHHTCISRRLKFKKISEILIKFIPTLYMLIFAFKQSRFSDDVNRKQKTIRDRSSS